MYVECREREREQLEGNKRLPVVMTSTGKRLFDNRPYVQPTRYKSVEFYQAYRWNRPNFNANVFTDKLV
jgi:hypothetical protein